MYNTHAELIRVHSQLNSTQLNSTQLNSTQLNSTLKVGKPQKKVLSKFLLIIFMVAISQIPNSVLAQIPNVPPDINTTHGALFPPLGIDPESDATWTINNYSKCSLDVFLWFTLQGEASSRYFPVSLEQDGQYSLPISYLYQYWGLSSPATATNAAFTIKIGQNYSLELYPNDLPLIINTGLEGDCKCLVVEWLYTSGGSAFLTISDCPK